MERYLEKDSGLTNTGAGYKLDLPEDDLIKRRRIEEARRRADSNPLPRL